MNDEGMIMDNLSEKRTPFPNICLIGMPGSGKSTIGKQLAQKLGYVFMDADHEFEEIIGISPADYIESFGVPKFRQKESELLAEFRKCTRTVISMGGGVVEIPSNRELLHAAGIAVYIKRDLEKLARGGRPVTAAKGVDRLYEERHEAYETWAELCVENNGEVSDAVESLYRMLTCGYPEVFWA